MDNIKCYIGCNLKIITLCLQQQSGGEINMLQTEFSRTVQELIEMYLVRQDSIPAFLSGLTLELLSRQTMNFGWLLSH